MVLDREREMGKLKKTEHTETDPHLNGGVIFYKMVTAG